MEYAKPVLEFDIPIYGGRVYCFTSIEDYNSFRAYLKCAPLDDPSAGYCTQYHNNITGAILYSVMVADSRPSTLVHELGHLTHQILDFAGVKDEEAFCYLLDYLFRECGGDANLD
jgi:hypothetical protein